MAAVQHETSVKPTPGAGAVPGLGGLLAAKRQ
jgi:hypothetical protein